MQQLLEQCGDLQVDHQAVQRGDGLNLVPNSGTRSLTNMAAMAGWKIHHFQLGFFSEQKVAFSSQPC